MPAAPIREHVEALRAAGMPVAHVRDAAGVPSNVMGRLVWGISGKPAVRIRADYAAAILAVTARPAMVDATGTTRRLRALALRGWTAAQVAERAGIGADYVKRLARAQRSSVPRSTAEGVSRAHAQMWDRDPAPTPAAKVVRAAARRAGYLPTAAWDDETIDDPAATPWTPTDHGDDLDPIAVARAVAGDPPATLTHAERAEAVRVLTERGASTPTIADLLGVTDRTVTRLRKAAA